MVGWGLGGVVGFFLHDVLHGCTPVPPSQSRNLWPSNTHVARVDGDVTGGRGGGQFPGGCDDVGARVHGARGAVYVRTC